MDTKTLNDMTQLVAREVLAAAAHSPDATTFESSDQEVEHQRGLEATGTFCAGADVTGDAFTFRLYHDVDRVVPGRRGPGSRVPVGKVVYTVTVRATYTAEGE